MTDRDDVLKRASASLSELGAPSDEDVARLRARVMASLGGGGEGGGAVVHLSSRRKLRGSLRWLLPLAAALAAGTALAATPSVYATLHDALERVIPFVFAPPERAVAARAQRVEAGLRTPAFQPAAPARDDVTPEHASAVVSAPAPAPATQLARAAQRPPQPAGAARTPRRERPAAVAPGVASAGVSGAPAVQLALAPPPLPLAPAAAGELDAFRRAQALQHKAHDYAAALVAWDAFLASLPQGTLALEARYQRALCLVRLGRRSEAARALAPFASGEEPGAYKQAEAAALRAALAALLGHSP